MVNIGCLVRRSVLEIWSSAFYHHPAHRQTTPYGTCSQVLVDILITKRVIYPDFVAILAVQTYGVTSIPPPVTAVTGRAVEYWACVVIRVECREMHSISISHHVLYKIPGISGNVDRIVSAIVIQIETIVFQGQPLVQVVEHFNPHSTLFTECHLMNSLQAHPEILGIISESSLIHGPFIVHTHRSVCSLLENDPIVDWYNRDCLVNSIDCWDCDVDCRIQSHITWTFMPL